MPLAPIPGFCNQSSPSRWRGISAARTVNLRLELNEDPGAKSQYTLYPRSGKKLFGTLPTAPVIGMWSNGFRMFVVSGPVGGATVYEVFQDATFTALGIVDNDGENPATMRANGTQLVICSAGKVYIATGTDLYQPIINFASGSVSVNGTAVTWLSGDQFGGSVGDVPGADIQPGDLFMLAPNLYTVQSVDPDGIHLTLTTGAGVLANAPYQVGSEKVTGVMVEFIDGYFIVNVPNTRVFRISNLFDGSTWDALDFQQKSGSVDNIAAIASISSYLSLIGESDSTEIWGDSGNAQFPFARVSGQTINMGIAAPWAFEVFTDSSAAWLMTSDGGEYQVVISSGGAPKRISNHALENEMRKYGEVDDAITSTYIENGHEYFRIDFPSANHTWEWDKTNPAWVELGITTPLDEVYGCDHGRYRVHIVWPNRKPMDVVGDFASGKLWQVSPDFTNDDGTEIPLLRIAPHINTNLEVMGSPAFALDCELGTVDPALLGLDGKELIPTVSMSYSDDGARTWTDAGAASLGRAGEYQGTYLTDAEKFDNTPNSQTNPQVFESRPYWTGLGSFWISRTYKIKSVASQLRAIYNGLAEISQ